jgi:phosphonoacetate hydrolase
MFIEGCSQSPAFIFEFMSKKIILIAIILTSYCLSFSQSTINNYFLKYYQHKRIVVIMFDGFGMSYFANSPHPVIDQMLKTGFYKEVKALMPTVTNTNNVSICTGTFPEENGITGNSYLDEQGKEEYMESSQLVRVPNLFEKLKKYNKNSALISSKKKTLGLLSPGTSIALSPESADSEWIKLLGTPPSIYSAEINYWSFEAALYILKNKQDINCVYIHTTDYPMHAWHPADTNSKKHIAAIDHYIGEIARIAPDAVIFITADHDMNHKNRCVDIEKSLERQGIKIKIAISVERDKYLVHHRGFGGTSYVYLDSKKDSLIVRNALSRIKGIKTILTRGEAAKKYHLDSSRIGDLIVLGDPATVFGNLETTEENVPEAYRTHGSEYETRVPLMIFNASKLPSSSYFIYNKDLLRWLFETI